MPKRSVIKKNMLALTICTKCGVRYLESSNDFKTPLDLSARLAHPCTSCGGKRRLVHPGEMGFAREIFRVECPACRCEQYPVPSDPASFVCRVCGYKALNLEKYPPDFKRWGQPRGRGKFHLYHAGHIPAACGYTDILPPPNTHPETLDQCCRHCLAKVIKDPEQRKRWANKQKFRRWCDTRCDHQDNCLIPCHISRKTGEKYDNYEADRKRLCGF